MHAMLIVDDNRLMRHMVRRAVTMAGVEAEVVDEAGDGEEALAKVRAAAYDLVLLDVNMPRMDGERFLATLRGEPALRTLPVVVVSSESSDVRLRRLRLMGAAIVPKPFRPDQLRAALAQVGAGPAAHAGADA